MTGGLLALLILAFLVLVIIAKTAIVVPQQSAYVVERLGRFSAILNAGFHVLLPFVDVIRYRHSLKEIAVDIPAQVCITRDNVQVGVDGVLYLKVLNPERASYGISDYMFAISQLAQTTLTRDAARAGSSAPALMPTGTPSEIPAPQSSVPANATGVLGPKQNITRPRTAMTVSARITGTRP